MTADASSTARRPRCRRIATASRLAGPPAARAWDGRDDAGGRAPDGRYRVRVNLRREGRAVPCGRALRPRHDAAAPDVFSSAARHQLDHRPGRRPGAVPCCSTSVEPLDRDHASCARTAARRARSRAFTLPARRPRAASWDGRAAGAPAPPGTYRGRGTVRDRAGNVGASAAAAEPSAGALPGRPGITVRGAARASRRADRCAAGQRRLRRRLARAPVSAGACAASAPRARVKRAGAHGAASRCACARRTAPSGVYLLDAAAATDTHRSRSSCRPPSRAPMLVVLPGDHLARARRGRRRPRRHAEHARERRAGRWPRLLAPTGCRPASPTRSRRCWCSSTASSIRYDLTTRPDARRRRAAARAASASGVLLAGAAALGPRARARLRRYVADGGRLASFGADTLRRGVGVARDRLAAAAAADRRRPVRRAPAAAAPAAGTRVTRCSRSPTRAAPA